MLSFSLDDQSQIGQNQMLPYPIAIIDLETTGMSPTYERVIEVGVCIIDDGIIEEEWRTLVNPGIDELL